MINEIIKFVNDDFQLDVTVSPNEETVWLTQKQMAELFDVKSQAITRHLKNIYNDEELFKEATCSKMEQIQMEGSRKITRKMDFYNLDAIIAVGYRVNSKKVTSFRRWATSILKKYMIKNIRVHMNNEIIKFNNGNLELDVTVTPDKDTVWLTANQMALLFDRDEKTIRKHINNTFKDHEVEKENNTQKMRVVGVKQSVPFYSLDVIISVGYRVKSKHGIIFRKWATSILKDYMIKGYAVNQKRLDVLNKTIAIQSRMLASALSIEEKEVLNVIEAYSNALTLLDDYDHGTIPKPDGIASVYQLTYEEWKLFRCIWC